MRGLFSGFKEVSAVMFGLAVSENSHKPKQKITQKKHLETCSIKQGIQDFYLFLFGVNLRSLV